MRLFHLKLVRKHLREPGKFLRTAVNLTRARRVDTCLVSWPKTGRTWLRVLIGRALVLHCGLEEGRLLDTYGASMRGPGDRLMFTHGGRFHLPETRSAERLTFRHRPYADRKVVFLIRDLRDTLVSHYYQASRRMRVFGDDIHRFIRDETFGAGKVVAFTNLWFRNRHVPRDFLLVRYEDMKADALRELRRVLDFVRLDGISDEYRGKVAEALMKIVAEHGFPECDWYYAPPSRSEP